GRDSFNRDRDRFLDQEALVAAPAQGDRTALARHRREGEVGVGGNRRRQGHADDLAAVPGGAEGVDDVARDDAAVGAGAVASLHRMLDEGLDLDDVAATGLLGGADQGIGHQVRSSTQAAMVTMTWAVALRNSPVLVSAIATTRWASASLMRVETTARPQSG